MQFTIYNDNETINQYMGRVNEYDTLIKKDKYNTILEFVNNLMNKDKDKYKSLTQFSNIPSKKIIYNKHLIEQYTNKLANLLKISVIELTWIDDQLPDSSSTLDNLYTIMFLKRILKSIDYLLISKIVNNEIYYTIKHK